MPNHSAFSERKGETATTYKARTLDGEQTVDAKSHEYVLNAHLETGSYIGWAKEYLRTTWDPVRGGLHFSVSNNQ